MIKKEAIPWNKGKTFKKGKPVELICIGCNQEFIVPARYADRKYCSQKCMYENWGTKKVCPQCDTEFKARKSSVYCSRSCRNKANPIEYTEERKQKLSEACKGINAGEKNHWYGKTGELSPSWREKSPHWNGGSSFFPYSLDWSKQLKEEIRERDDYTCVVCGNEGKDVHHIDYDKQNCEEYNLITLCRSCHMKTNHNRKEWIKYFMEEITNVN